MTEDSAVWLDDHQQRVWRLWLEVSTTLPAVLNRQLSRDSQLSVQDFEVLVRLSETDGGDMRVVALAEHMGWERSRLSHHLTRMEKRGLIERRVCCSDGRDTHIYDPSSDPHLLQTPYAPYRIHSSHAHPIRKPPPREHTEYAPTPS